MMRSVWRSLAKLMVVRAERARRDGRQSRLLLKLDIARRRADEGRPSRAVSRPAAACRREGQPWGWGPAALMEERGQARERRVSAFAKLRRDLAEAGMVGLRWAIEGRSAH